MSTSVVAPPTGNTITDAKASSHRIRQTVTTLLALVILIPSLWGFGSKFVEFVVLCHTDQEGAFAIMPVLNYLLASSGFLMLFGWAVYQGMFREIEKPKHTMLENEHRLDNVAPNRNL